MNSKTATFETNDSTFFVHFWDVAYSLLASGSGMPLIRAARVCCDPKKKCERIVLNEPIGSPQKTAGSPESGVSIPLIWSAAPALFRKKLPNSLHIIPSPKRQPQTHLHSILKMVRMPCTQYFSPRLSKFPCVFTIKRSIHRVNPIVVDSGCSFAVELIVVVHKKYSPQWTAEVHRLHRTFSQMSVRTESQQELCCSGLRMENRQVSCSIKSSPLKHTADFKFVRDCPNDFAACHWLCILRVSWLLS